MKHFTSKRRPVNPAVTVPRGYPWHVLSALCTDLQTFLSEKDIARIRGYIRSRDHVAIESWLTDTLEQCNTGWADTGGSHFACLYQVLALLKKYRFDSDKQTRVDAAKRTFFAAEDACSYFNRYGWTELVFSDDARVLRIFNRAQAWLGRLLGPELPEWEKLTLWSRHGPGANLDTKNGQVSLYDKYRNWPYSCTEDALDVARLAIESDERWLGALEDSYRERFNVPKHTILDRQVFWRNIFHVVDGNRITFVPKNAKTERSIAIEPCMNLYLQLGVDGFIRRRLKRWDIDLDSQEKNQVLAYEGSLHWDSEDPYCTIDLSAASDSVSLKICELMLPPAWYHYLLKLRSPKGDLNGEVINFEKISSMGNGYTFALESAIFAAFAFAVEKEHSGTFDSESVAVFGDDIIVRSSRVNDLYRLLNLSGFAVNSSKSFTAGPFRESCGSDWFRGTPVRPVFLTDQPSTVYDLWCDANRLRRILSLRYLGFEFECVRYIVDLIPERFRNLTGPLSDESFDSYLHMPSPTLKRRRGIYNVRTLCEIPRARRGGDFLFRKLMHPLRQLVVPRSLWDSKRLGGTESVFDILKRNSSDTSYVVSLAYTWQDEYNESQPRERRKTSSR